MAKGVLDLSLLCAVSFYYSQEPCVLGPGVVYLFRWGEAVRSHRLQASELESKLPGFVLFCSLPCTTYREVLEENVGCWWKWFVNCTEVGKCKLQIIKYHQKDQVFLSNRKREGITRGSVIKGYSTDLKQSHHFPGRLFFLWVPKRYSTAPIHLRDTLKPRTLGENPGEIKGTVKKHQSPMWGLTSSPSNFTHLHAWYEKNPFLDCKSSTKFKTHNLLEQKNILIFTKPPTNLFLWAECFISLWYHSLNTGLAIRLFSGNLAILFPSQNAFLNHTGLSYSLQSTELYTQVSPL